jgi:hypothetical protein
VVCRSPRQWQDGQAYRFAVVPKGKMVGLVVPSEFNTEPAHELHHAQHLMLLPTGLRRAGCRSWIRSILTMPIDDRHYKFAGRMTTMSPRALKAASHRPVGRAKRQPRPFEIDRGL